MHVITVVTENTFMKLKTWQGFTCINTLKMQLLLVVMPHVVACLKFQNFSLGYAASDRWQEWMLWHANSWNVCVYTYWAKNWTS